MTYDYFCNKHSVDNLKSVEGTIRSALERFMTLLKELESLLKKSGSVDFCFGRIDYCVQEAISSLEHLRESIYKNYLKQMAETLKLK
jgi:hypothetical protein